ncbi:hypothetical protein I4I80_02735 [Pseudomonas syringae pv. tomato]|nr:hypothetical protein [Pseudomonas syringae pv. tomato]MBW8023658.1 hypothetical protein [Pseudomonas syringae pv. tomato]
MKNILMSLFFGCLVLVVAIGINQLFGIGVQDIGLGLNGAIYAGIFLFGILAFHKLTERSGMNVKNQSVSMASKKERTDD